jgi:hypothetical protein
MSRLPRDDASGQLPITLETRRSLALAHDRQRALSLELRAPEPDLAAGDMDLRA